MSFKYHRESIYFVTYKTKNAELFFLEDDDKKILYNKIIEAKQKYNLICLAVSVVSNHYHILWRSEEYENISKALQLINGGSSYLLNKKYQQRRKIWDKQNKFNWLVKNEESFFKFLGYILGNPLKHGLVSNLEELAEYKFCNYNDVLLNFEKDFIDSQIIKSLKLESDELDKGNLF